LNEVGILKQCRYNLDTAQKLMPTEKGTVIPLKVLICGPRGSGKSSLHHSYSFNVFLQESDGKETDTAVVNVLINNCPLSVTLTVSNNETKMQTEFRDVHSIIISFDSYTVTDDEASRWIRFAMLTWPLRPICITYSKNDDYSPLEVSKDIQYKGLLRENIVFWNSVSSFTHRGLIQVFDQAYFFGLYYRYGTTIPVSSKMHCNIC
jgi:GTPase SAR1 family protein